MSDNSDGQYSGATDHMELDSHAATEDMDLLIDSLPPTVGAMPIIEYLSVPDSSVAAADPSTLNMPIYMERDLIDEGNTGIDVTIYPESVESGTADYRYLLPSNTAEIDVSTSTNQNYSTDTDRSINLRPYSSIPAISREMPPREMRLSMGPYAVVCAEHYLQRRRVPEETGDELETVSSSNNYHNMSEFSPKTEQNQALFLPLSPNPSRVNVEAVQIDVHIGATVDETNAEVTEVMNLPVNQEMNDHQWNRPYISRSLLEVEDATKNWFLREQYRNNPVSQQTETTEFFSLQFNETSLSTIALWVAGGSKRKCGPDATLHRPIVDTRFRVCCICNMYGHYEVECQQITPELTKQFSQWMTNDRKSDKELKTMPKNDTFQQKCDVTVEMCCGYMIEQRSQAEVHDARFRKGLQTGANATKKGLLEPNIVQTTRHPSRRFKIEEFNIQEGETIEALSSGCVNSAITSTLLDEGQAMVSKGSLVTWSINTDGTIADFPGILAVGTVVDIDLDSNRVQVHVIRTIEAKSNGRRKEWPDIDTLLWVPAKFLYNVDERNSLLPADSVPIRKTRKYTKAKAEKKLKTTNMLSTTETKVTKQVAVHVEPPPIKVKRSEARPSKLPLSNKRDELVWDANEGVWVLPPEDMTQSN